MDMHLAATAAILGCVAPLRLSSDFVAVFAADLVILFDRALYILACCAFQRIERASAWRRAN